MSGDNCNYCTSKHLSYYAISIKQIDTIVINFNDLDKDLIVSGWYIYNLNTFERYLILNSSNHLSIHICFTCRFINKSLIGPLSCEHEIIINCREKRIKHTGLIFKEDYKVSSKLKYNYIKYFDFKTIDHILYHIDLESNLVEEGVNIPKLKLTDYSEEFIYKSPINSPNTTIYDYIKKENNKSVVDKAIEYVFGDVNSIKETSKTDSIKPGTMVGSKKRSSNEL
jgi:hypothetical protein